MSTENGPENYSLDQQEYGIIGPLDEFDQSSDELLNFLKATAHNAHSPRRFVFRRRLDNLLGPAATHYGRLYTHHVMLATGGLREIATDMALLWETMDSQRLADIPVAYRRSVERPQDDFYWLQVNEAIDAGNAHPVASAGELSNRFYKYTRASAESAYSQRHAAYKQSRRAQSAISRLHWLFDHVHGPSKSTD